MLIYIEAEAAEVEEGEISLIYTKIVSRVSK